MKVFCINGFEFLFRKNKMIFFFFEIKTKRSICDVTLLTEYKNDNIILINAIKSYCV